MHINQDLYRELSLDIRLLFASIKRINKKKHQRLAFSERESVSFTKNLICSSQRTCDNIEHCVSIILADDLLRLRYSSTSAL